MLIRAEFEKLQLTKYVSHLELMTTFRRAFRRAELPVAYSQGFNPHVILSLCQPLKVGMEGRSEYFDLELSKDISLENFISTVNSSLPEGIKILQAREVPEKTKSLMAIIDTAVYRYQLSFTEQVLDEEKMLSDFLAESELRIIRNRRNKQDIELDIRPLIYDAQVLESGNWIFRVKSGSSGNLRAEEVVEALVNYFEVVEYIPLVRIVREGLYVKIGEEFYSPLNDKVIGS